MATYGSDNFYGTSTTWNINTWGTWKPSESWEPLAPLSKWWETIYTSPDWEAVEYDNLIEDALNNAFK